MSQTSTRVGWNGGLGFLKRSENTTDERYKKIMNDFGIPNSLSLLNALKQVANEAAQDAQTAERNRCAIICELEMMPQIAEMIRKA